MNPALPSPVSKAAESATAPRSPQKATKADCNVFGALLDHKQQPPVDVLDDGEFASQQPLARRWSGLHPAFNKFSDRVEAERDGPSRANEGEDAPSIPLPVPTESDGSLTPGGLQALLTPQSNDHALQTFPGATLQVADPAKQGSPSGQRLEIPAPKTTAAEISASATEHVPVTSQGALSDAQLIERAVSGEAPLAAAARSLTSKESPTVAAKTAPSTEESEAAALPEVLNTRKQVFATPAAPEPAAAKGWSIADKEERAATSTSPALEVEGYEKPAPPAQFSAISPSGATAVTGPVALALDPVVQPALTQAARRVTEAEVNQLTPARTTETLKLQLRPVDLGSVVAVLHSAGGVLTIDLQVESAEAHHKLTHEKEAIGKAIRDLGFDLDAVTVQHTLSPNPASARDGHGASMNSGGGLGENTQARQNGNEADQDGETSRGFNGRSGDDGEKRGPKAATVPAERAQPGHYI